MSDSDKIKNKKLWCPDCQHHFEGTLCMDCMGKDEE